MGIINHLNFLSCTSSFRIIPRGQWTGPLAFTGPAVGKWKDDRCPFCPRVVQGVNIECVCVCVSHSRPFTQSVTLPSTHIQTHLTLPPSHHHPPHMHRQTQESARTLPALRFHTLPAPSEGGYRFRVGMVTGSQASSSSLLLTLSRDEPLRRECDHEGIFRVSWQCLPTDTPTIGHFQS